MGFYLMFRFYYSREMEDRSIDFLDNQSWFYIKLLTEFNADDNCALMDDATYAKAIKKVCREHRIPTRHFVHFGRVNGALMAELNEEDRQEISNLGNWGLNVQEQRYSTKIPLGIIRGKANLESKANWNPRTALAVPIELQNKVFPWLQSKKKAFDDAEDDNIPKATARCFLALMCDLQSIVIQDAAAMIAQHPDRRGHCLFQLPVFQEPLFQQYCVNMKNHLANSESPFDVSAESIYPGLKNRFDVLQTGLSANTIAVNNLVEEVSDFKQRVSSIPGQVQRETRYIVGDALVGVGTAIGTSSHPRTATAAEGRGVATATAPVTPSPFGRRQPPAYPGFNYKLPLSIKSATEIWNVWHGLGSYQDKPVEGGVEELERSKRKQWRKKYDINEKRMFSRWKNIIKYMKEEMGDRELGVFLEEMDGIYTSMTAKKISPFEQLMKQRRDLRMGDMAVAEIMT